MAEEQEKHADEIQHKLDNIVGASDEGEIKKLDLSQFSSKLRNRYEEIESTLNVSFKHLGSADSAEKDRVIEHVGEALRDIDEIEKKPRLTSQKVDEQLAAMAPKIREFQQTMLNQKDMEFTTIEEYVSRFVDLAGPNRDTTALFLSVEYGADNYLASHTMNVMLLSISLAIELSKMMEVKITDKNITNDFKKVLICNRKIFTRKELIEVGTAALLHDLFLSKSFPNLKKDQKFDFKEESLIEKHPAEAYHFLKANFPSFDFEIKKAVYQHHEYMDGSGHPNGVHARFFSRYAPVLSFAVHFVEHTTENPFHTMKHPHVTLQSMMKQLRERFDDDLLLAYVRGAGFYPLGSWVLLNSGQIGVVVANNKQAAKNPVVRAVLNSRFEQIDYQDIDTAASNVRVHAPVPFLEVKKRVQNYREILLAGETPPSPFVKPVEVAAPAPEPETPTAEPVE